MDERLTDSAEIFEHGFTRVPAFFVDDLMPIASGVPASFWKYLFIVWRDCFQRPYRCSRTMTQFHLTKDTARKWTAALSVSGLFYVRYGKRHEPNLPGIPTEIRYKADCTEEEWLCFITSLRDTILADKKQHYDDVNGFRIQLAINLHAERRRNGLSISDLERYLDNLAEGVKKVGSAYDLDSDWREESDRRGVLTAKDRVSLYGD